MQEDPTVIKHFKDVDVPSDPRETSIAGSEKIYKQVSLPPSLKKDDLGKGAAMLKRFGAFGEDE